MPEEILSHFPLNNPGKDLVITPFGSGLINRTWKVQVEDANESYILQNINSAVFRALNVFHPRLISHDEKYPPDTLPTVVAV